MVLMGRWVLSLHSVFTETCYFNKLADGAGLEPAMGISPRRINSPLPATIRLPINFLKPHQTSTAIPFSISFLANDSFSPGSGTSVK